MRATVDPQFLAEHGDFGFQLVDSRVFRIAILDQSFAPSEHRDSNDADDIEHRAANERVPVLGESQRFDVFFTDFGRHGGDPEITQHSKSPPAKSDAADVIDEIERVSSGTRPNLSIATTIAVIDRGLCVRQSTGETRWACSPCAISPQRREHLGFVQPLAHEQCVQPGPGVDEVAFVAAGVSAPVEELRSVG